MSLDSSSSLRTDVTTARVSIVARVPVVARVPNAVVDATARLQSVDAGIGVSAAVANELVVVVLVVGADESVQADDDLEAAA